MDHTLQEEEQNSDGNLNTGQRLAESHNSERNEENHRSGSSPSTSGTGPETATQMDVDNGNQTTGQHSAEAQRNTPGQPAVSGPLTGQTASPVQQSEHSILHNDLETDTPMDVDNGNQTTGQHSAEAQRNTPGQPAVSGQLTGQLSEHFTQYNIKEGPGSSANDSTVIKTQERKIGGNPTPGSTPSLASSSGVGQESSQTETEMRVNNGNHTTRQHSAEAQRNTPDQSALREPLTRQPGSRVQQSEQSAQPNFMCVNIRQTPFSNGHGPSAGDLTGISTQERKGGDKGQPAVRGLSGIQSTTLLQSSVDSTQHSTISKSLGPSARNSTEVESCVDSSACKDDIHQEDNSFPEVYFDASDGEDMDRSSKAYKQENWQLLSKTPSSPETIVIFVAVLRRAIKLEGQDRMYLISNNGKKIPMNFIWRDDEVGSLFKCKFAVPCHGFAYQYCLAKNNKEGQFEDATPNKWFSIYKSVAYRRLSNIKDTDTVHYQFDDICMKNPSWTRWTGKSTKIDEVRLKFLKAVILYLMNYHNAMFSELQNILECFESSVKARKICSSKGQDDTIPLNLDSKLITTAFVEAVQMQSIQSSIQNVLVAAAIAKQFQLGLNKKSVEHISLIVKNSGPFQGNFSDSVHIYMASAVQHVLDMASRLKLPHAVVWLTGLFYAVCPPEHKQTLALSGFYISDFTSEQRDLAEMINKYSMRIGNQSAFASAVMQIFSPVYHCPQVLSKLNLSPNDLLLQLSVWSNIYDFHLLHAVIKMISSEIKPWVESRLQSNVFTDSEKREILFSLEQVMNIIKNSEVRHWKNHIDNVYSVLHLFNSFNGCLDWLECDQHFRAISSATLPTIIDHIRACIREVLFRKNLELEEWTKLFQIKSDIWQEQWEKSLTKLFAERLQKESDVKLIELCAKTSHCPRAMDECLLTHVTKAISRVYGKNRDVPLTSQQTLERGSLISIVSTCPGYGKILSLIIEKVSEDRKWNPNDYLHVLYDGQITEIFKTLAIKQKEMGHYKEHLSSKAKKFIQDTHTFLEQLPEYILSQSISCLQISKIIVRKKQPNTYTILKGPNLKQYHEAVQEAEKSFKSFREMQRNMRALHNICQGSQVDIQPLRSVMSLDLSTEKRSLRDIMERLSPDSEENPQFINIQIFEKIAVLSDSTYFKQIWRKVAEHVKKTEFENVSSVPLNQVYKRIFKPAVEEYRNSFEKLMNLSMTLEDLEDKMGKFLKKDIQKELQYMKQIFNDSKSGWVENTYEHIKRYQELCLAVENANVVNVLKDKLGLRGDFYAIGNLQVMSDKCLRDLTLEMHKAGETVKKFPNYVISFLKELSICVENGFISWIKEIIKDTGELSAFVELASISAGENALDIDKVCYFRDAISAAAPLIYGLTENSGFAEFKSAVRDVQSELLNDKTLKEKLRDSCKNRDWLEIAYETHGSVERSSLRQATDINESGIYTIRRPLGQTMVTLENCIALKCKEVSSDGKSKYRPYSLTELKELQNKLMLITVTQDDREDGITNYVEVLEHMINVGRCFIELCDAGHVLFKDWEMTAYCEREREAKIWVNFGLTNVEIKGNRPLLEELKGLCESMTCCLSEWLKYVEAKRNKYYTLNHFTAKQLVNLCCSMAEVQHKNEISGSLLNMLSIMKEDITDEDVKIALTNALQTPVEDSGAQGSAQLKRFLSIYPDHIEYFTGFGLTEEVSKAGIMYCEEQAHEGGTSPESVDKYRDFVLEHIDEHQDDEDWVQEWSEKYEKTKKDVLDNQMKFKGGHSSEQISSFTMTEDEISSMFENLNHCDEKIVMLWRTYQNKLSGLVSDKFVDLDVLGETIQHIANSTTIAIVQRQLPFGLEPGKPNLISCKYAEMAPLCLSVYRDEEQPLPSYDEILICTPETTAEEVELILRRALQFGSRHEKTYSLLNADKLNHEVSRQLESTFYKLSKTQDRSIPASYRLIICCDLKANHSYVTTAFDNYKRTLPEDPHRNEKIKQYLKVQHKMPDETKDGFGKLHCFQNFPQMTKLVFSEHAGMGKSLYVKSLVNAMEDVKKEGFTHKTIRLSESHLRPEHIIQQFQAYEDKPTDTVPRLFHFDVPPVVSKGLYSFLLQLFALRCFQSPDGSMWRCSKSHVYLVEYTRRRNRECDQHNSEISTEIEEAFLEMFPNVKCLSPEETQMHLSEGCPSDEEYQLMDKGEFSSEAFQRTYQYFKRYEQNQLESFSFTPGSCEDSPKEWLQCLMYYCDNRTPSWGELRNFTHFLNMQLKKCEQSVFCSDILSQDLTGFKKFVVKSMITMSKDFSMRSLMISDESTGKEMNPEEDAVLKEFQLRRRWEQEAHPYIMFNADNNSMTFLGFHIHNLDAIDSRTGQVVEKRVIDRVLFNQLKAQKVPFNIDFEKLKRKEQLNIISRVLGVDNITDPDDTYQLTLDNVMKILAIHLRFESDIPVIIMGETGCGKTRLVQFMCEMLRSGKQGKNMIVVRVHGGTTSETIYRKVQEAVEISKSNETQDMDTVLFFDEANTTEAVNAIKEVICDKSVNGELIDAHRLKIIAACNPYKKHSQEAIEQLEKAGLGYRVRSENTEEKLGQIPMRQLVYRVQPLPPSLSPLVWDFGKLNEKTQELYIHQMVKTFFQKENLPEEYESLFTKVISASQMHMVCLTDECRMVSLRDIERCMKTVMWFYQQRHKLFPEMDEHSPNTGVHELVRSLILAIGVCYMASLEKRGAYLEKVAKELSLTSEAIRTEIESCKKVFIENVDCPPSVAKNDALKENVFMMVVCMNLRIPLFLVGKPGSSKSLSKTIAAHAMQGKSSQRELFKGLKKAQLASFQCSPHSSPDGIISVFRQCAQFQKDKNLDEYVSVVVLDEIGLAEDSPKMPLKTLHPLLEYGCVDDEHPEDFKKVSFIGISNWSLDPAKMNRGILVLRTSPEFEELENTALAICPQEEEHILPEIKILISLLTEFYQKVLDEQKKFSEFFGLRDFYSLVKLVVSYAIEKNGRPSNEELTRAVQRNFGGFDSIDILKIFWDVFAQKTEKCDTISLLRENLEGTSGFTSRYLLLPTTNHVALQILKLKGIITEETTEVIFGSGFPHDEEYSQVCRTVNKVKACMETGTPVILLNIQSLYESLYDALNQCYVKLGGSYYVDLGLGSHRVKCRVKDEFRLIVIEEKSTVYEQFPTPLLNRLEKHCVEINNILPPYAKEMQNELENWLKVFVTIDMYEEEATDILKKKHDCIIGYTEDTCASVLLQCCPDIVSRCQELHDSESDVELADSDKRHILDLAKEKLLQCATPDSVLKASKHDFSGHDTLLEVYFVKQPHGNMMKTLMNHRKEQEGLNLEVSTFSRLLNKRDLEQINNQLNIGENDSCLYLLNEFYTEQSFSQTLRDFLVGDTGARKLVLLQSYFECAKQSQRILFCVRHSIMRLRNMLKGAPLFDVVLITRLPRISGGCGYIASFGDDWMSLHLDELIPTPGFPGDIYQLQSMTVSEILQESAASCFEENDMEGLPESRPAVKEVSLVDTVLLIKKSLQKGILQLQDKTDNTQRATKRIEILHGLLHNKYKVSEAFIAILQRRIISLLAQEKKENWVIAQALSGHLVVEGGSFRHMLWVYLEDTVASALAQILAVIDGDNNLDNLINDSSPEMTELWLKIFQEEKWDLLNIPATQSQGKVCVVSSTRLNNKSRTCLFPFGWVLKERLHCLWSNVINLKGLCPYPRLEYLEKFEELIPLDWVKDIKGKSELFAQFSEDLVNMTMTAYPHDLNKSFSDTLLKLTPCLYHDLTGKDPENVSLPWLFVAYQYMQDNHQHFYKLYLQNNDLVDAGEATEALRRTIESLQPKEDIMKDFAGCQDWIKKVKSLSMSVEVMLSENSLVTRLRENGTQLLTKIRLFWQSTRIMYLLMDHLLQHETDMEKKLLILLVRNLIWMWKNLNSENGTNLEYVIQKVTGTLTKCGKNACNIFMVYCAYCDKEFTENDTVKLKCGHMFHLSCLREHSDTHCRKCKKEIDNTDYKECGVVDKETFLKVSRFRRKCSSFFVEFMWNFVPTNAKLTDKIVEELLNYVRGSSSSEAKKEEKSTLEECLKSDSATYSLVLKILLRCGMEDSASQLQKFMDAAVSSSEDNTEELYFMIVRSIEDHIHTSNQGCLNQKAQECLSTCTLSTSDPDNITAEDLHMFAKLRFAISVASDVIHTVITEGEQVITDKGNKQLLQSLQMLISDSNNPWIQIFLLRNVCKMYGFSFIHQLGDKFKWAMPHESFVKQDTSAEQMDPLFMYGDLYECIILDSMDQSQEISEGIDRSSEFFSVCVALAAVRQATLNRNGTLQGSESSLIEKMKVEPNTDEKWRRLSRICEKMIEDPLKKLSPSLSQIVFHTVVVVHESSAPEVALLRTLCFRPENAKDFYLPTMPSSMAEITNWIKPTDGDMNVVWKCQCGEPVIIGNCGKPWVTNKCVNCGQDVGGKSHEPVEGFQKTDPRNEERNSGKGHNLGDPGNRKDQDGERNLFGAHLFLVRALIHSSLIWGTVDHPEEIQNIVQYETINVREYLYHHLQKDIDLLAHALGKSVEDAKIAVHLFLKHIMETKSDTENQIAATETEEKRMNWETSIHQKLQTLFMNFEDCFASVHSNILRKGGLKTVAQIVYNLVPDLKDLPTTGVFNLPLMWRFEQKMTIQLLSHLIEQKDEWTNLPVLTELLKNSGHIRYIRYLPQVLSLQHKVMHHFRNVDLQCYKDVPIPTFKKENIPDAEGQMFDKGVEIMKTIWDHLTTIGYLRMPKEMMAKKKKDLRILDLLPRPKSVIYIVTDYLIRMQNDCINCANPKENRFIRTSEVKPSHVIDCTPEQDFLTLAMSNIDRVVSEDGTESTNYNFKSLERQIVDRFFTEKPMISLDSIPAFEYNTGTTLRAFFSTVKEHLVPLSTNERNSILNDFRFLNEISAALSTLKIAIGFMQLSFPSDNEYLVTYLKKDLKLEDRTQTLSLPVLRTSRVKHIQSLWEVLSLRQSSLLLEMNQDPFFMIESGFHETFSEDEKKKITSNLANLIKMELFITELHYVIMSIQLKEVAPDWGLQETFDAFVDYGEIDEGVLESVESLMELNLQMKNSIALWKMAVEMRRGLYG